MKFLVSETLEYAREVFPQIGKIYVGDISLQYVGQHMAETQMDERGRILIPSKERRKLGLKPGTRFEVVEEKGVLRLRPIITPPVRVTSKRTKWGEDAFLDAGEATFGG